MQAQILTDGLIGNSFFSLVHTTIGLLGVISAAVGLLVGMGSDELPGGVAPAGRD